MVRSPEIIIVPALFIMVGFIIWVVVNGWQRRLRLKLTTEFNSKLLDRIGSVKDFNEFLQTEGGGRFMDSLTVERGSTRPQDSILRAGQIGIVLITLGFGLLVLDWYFSVRYAGAGDTEVLTVIGVIAASLGLGFLISAGVSYRLAMMLGVLDRDGRSGGPGSPGDPGRQGRVDVSSR
jgi:hypothetical protein